ncbi:MAG TPA: hypothetical protein PLB41_05485 [Rubrivivax sp.]|nr:hypothetical protein [Rubrivivax sp.]
MTIELDHSIVSARDARTAAETLARLLGVGWAPRGMGPFSPVYVNDGLTLDSTRPRGAAALRRSIAPLPFSRAGGASRAAP